MDEKIFSIHYKSGNKTKKLDLNYLIFGEKISYFSFEEYDGKKAYVAYNESGSIIFVVFAKNVISLYFKLD